MALRVAYYDKSHKLEAGDIRLLKVMPRGKSDVIRLSLQITNLAEAKNDYDAISYMWALPILSTKF